MNRRRFKIALLLLLTIALGNPLPQAAGMEPAHAQDFSLLVTPADQQVCKPDEAFYIIDVQTFDGYVDQVFLSAAGLPSGTSVVFDFNPTMPPLPSSMFIENTGAAAEGSYTIDVSGQDMTGTVRTTSVGLHLFDAAPSQPTLLTPVDGANHIPLKPTFTWSAAGRAMSYVLKVSRDEQITDVVLNIPDLTETGFTAPTNLESNKSYYWQVTAKNACGDGLPSAAFHFTTTSASRHLFLPLVRR